MQVYEPALDMLENHVENGEVVVPEGRYFALGDNRDLSLDSRYWGFVPRENIIGKPLVIYWSYDAPTERLQDSGVSFAHIKDLVLNFFTKTRWRSPSRMCGWKPAVSPVGYERPRRPWREGGRFLRG